MTRNRLWVIALALACIAVLALGWFAGVAPQFTATKTADSQTADVAAENQTHETELTQLKKDFANVDDLQAKLAVLHASIPSTIDGPGLLASLNTTALQAGITLASVTIGDPSLYASASATPAAAAAATPAASASPSPSPSATAAATPAATAPATATTSAAPGTVAVNSADTALVSTGNFYSIPVTIGFGAGSAQLTTFLSALQTSTRLFLVTGVSLTASDATKGTGSVSGLVYVLSDPNAAVANK